MDIFLYFIINTLSGKYLTKLKKVILLLTILSVIVAPMFLPLVYAGCPCEEVTKEPVTQGIDNVSYDIEGNSPIMPMNPELIEERNRILTEGPFLDVDSQVIMDVYKSLSNHILYNPTERNQGNCGNCWVWAGTGVMEIAMSVQEGILARLSVQNFTSCHNGGANNSWACCGGNLGVFADRYSNVSYVIPWNNTNADWWWDGTDWARGCTSGPSTVPCNTIDTSCNYSITSIDDFTIPTWQQPMQTAIDNIKSVLDSNKGIYFSFCQGNWSEPGAFYDEWGNYGEDHIWPINVTCSQTWSPPASGCHAVVCLGYNDTDPDPSNHYWIMLNSWGTSGGGRPNGIFLVPMRMNYNCTIDNPQGANIIAFGFQTLNVTFDMALPVADADGPYSGNEGDSIPLDGSGSSDDGVITAYEWDLDDDGSFDDAVGVNPMYAWGDDYSGPIHLKVTDDDCLNDTDSTTATIDNVAPTVEAGGNQTVSEGTTVNFMGNFTDPGWLDTHTAVWDWGDGSPPEAGAVVEENIPPDSTGNVTGSHAYGQTGVYVVTLNVTDDDGGFSSDTLTVNVTNVPPTVEAGPDQVVNEGELVYFKGNFTDPSWLDTHTATWDYDDGSPIEAGALTEENIQPDATGNVTGEHNYGSMGVYVVTLNVTDDKGGWGTDTVTITVNNVPPTITKAKAVEYRVVCREVHVNFTGWFTDPSWLDTHTATWDWGDGSPPEPGAVFEEHNPPDSTGIVNGSHTYVYPPPEITVTLTVFDNHGDSDVYKFLFSVGPVGGEIQPVNSYVYLWPLLFALAIAVSIITVKLRKTSYPFFFQ
jgi:hypothetical protein